MNNFYKIVSTIFLVMFIFLFFAPAASFAAEANFIPQVSIGEFVAGQGKEVKNTGETLWLYIKAIYKYAIGVVGIVAAVVLMVGGIMWLTAGGNQTRIGEAKAYITASLTGLLLALTSFLILATVNPKLVEFNPLKVTDVGEMGCCKYSGGAISSTKDECDKKEGSFTKGECSLEGCCAEVEGGGGAVSCFKKTINDCKGSYYGVDETTCTSKCGIDFWNNYFEKSGSW